MMFMQQQILQVALFDAHLGSVVFQLFIGQLNRQYCLYDL